MNARHLLTAPGFNGKTIACWGKVRFATWNEAQRVVGRSPARSRITSKRQAYHCLHCGGVHVGSVEPGRRQLNRRPRHEYLEEA